MLNASIRATAGGLRFSHPAPRRNLKTLLACLMLVLAGVLLAGCAAVAPLAGAPLTAEESSHSRMRELTSAMAERAQRLDAMQTNAVMEYEGGGQHVKAKEQVVVKRPALMRVEALTPFGVAAVVASDGSRLYIYQTSDNTFYKGRATAATLNRFAGIPLPPRQAVRLLMGLLPDDAVNSANPKSVRTEDGLTIATYELSGGRTEELGFASGQLRMVRVDDTGGPSYEVHYEDYRDIGGLEFPHHLEAQFLNTGTRLNVRYSDVIVNPKLSNAQFTLVPRGTARQIDLDRPAPAGANG